jgi:hypothetical protein
MNIHNYIYIYTYWMILASAFVSFEIMTFSILLLEDAGSPWSFLEREVMRCWRDDILG